MSVMLRVLIVDDSEDDAQLIMRYLRAGDYTPNWKRVDTPEAMSNALDQKQWDVILCDYKMPLFTASEALELIQDRGIDIPFIIVSGAIGEDTAVAAMKSGAHDYLMKDNLSRLVVAIEREIREAKIRQEKKKAEENLNESEENFRQSLDDSPLGICIVTAEGKTLYANREILNIYGCDSLDELATTSHKKKYTPESYAQYEIRKEKRLRGEHVPSIYELSIIRKDGKIRHLEVFRKQVLWNGEIQFQTLYNDITERKQAEEALYEAQQVYRALIENSPDIIARYDRDGRRTYVNPTYLKVAQIPQPELLATAPKERSPLPAASAAVLQNLLRRVLDSGVAEAIDVIWPKSDNIDYWYNIFAFPELDRDGRVVSVMTVSRDITERKRAEETLENERKRMEVILSALDTGLSLINPDMTIAWVNQKVREMFPRGEPVGQVCHVFYESRTTICDGCGTLQAFKDGKVCESEQLVPASGRWYYIISQPIKDKAGRVVNVLEGITDITKRKQAENTLRESEEQYRLIAENTADTIAVFDLNLNPTYISPSILKLRGLTVEEAMTQTLNQMLTPDSLQQASKIFADQMALESSPTADPARTTLMELEEYCKDGSTIWVELAASFLRDNNFKPTAILTVTRDITERKKADERIRKALEATVQAIAVTVEERDPYTAGHQRKVADLARAIATEMKLPIDIIEGLRMAASIHDLGKISVPAEILSKPTKLTEIEFMLIKTHSQSGYDILKDIDFPWPLAEIVYQHHERMDGSGYPRNLKGDEIIMEARIMAVADTVEAMASHRPYRPGFGIEVALEEIKKNKGILYDDAVTDACLRLFREKGHQLT